MGGAGEGQQGRHKPSRSCLCLGLHVGRGAKERGAICILDDVEKQATTATTTTKGTVSNYTMQDCFTDYVLSFSGSYLPHGQLIVFTTKCG